MYNKCLDKITLDGSSGEKNLRWWRNALEKRDFFRIELENIKEIKDEMDKILRDKFGSGEVFANEKLFTKYFMEVQDLAKAFETIVKDELKKPLMQLRIDAAAMAIQSNIRMILDWRYFQLFCLPLEANKRAIRVAKAQDKKPVTATLRPGEKIIMSSVVKKVEYNPLNTKDKIITDYYERAGQRNEVQNNRRSILSKSKYGTDATANKRAGDLVVDESYISKNLPGIDRAG